jgi:hypothetical protein
MKTKIFLLFIGILTVGMIVSCKQGKKSGEKPEKNEIPVAVSKAFSEKFATATNVEWEAEEEGIFEAEFTLNGKEMSAEFTSDGTWKETETEVAQSDLPAVIVDSLESAYAEYIVEETEMCETPEGRRWEIALKKENTELSLVLDETGKILKMKEQEIEKKEGVGEEHEKGEKEEQEEEHP